MTKSDFLSKVPDYIKHPNFGYSELEIIVDKSNKKVFATDALDKKDILALVPTAKVGKKYIKIFYLI